MHEYYYSGDYCFVMPIRMSRVLSGPCIPQLSIPRGASRGDVEGDGSSFRGIPQSFATYLSKVFDATPDKIGETDKQLKLLDILEAHFPENVVAASYDYLKETNCSVAAYLICNASLRMTGQLWKECRDSINARSTAVRNLSPPHAAIDVVVLARAAYEMKRALSSAPCKPWPVVRRSRNVPKGVLISSSPAVLEAALQLPLRWGPVVSRTRLLHSSVSFQALLLNGSFDDRALSAVK